MIFIKNGTVNTVTKGIINSNILIDNKKIIEKGNDIVAQINAEVIDAKGYLEL